MWPKVSIPIPTLNSQNVLEACLKSISMQDYPPGQIEIIVGDGGSTDVTLEIAQKYGATIVHNPLKTGESGKMAALRVATGEFVALIDSDNELPSINWLKNMIDPLLKHPDALGSEPWEYTWRAKDGFVTRYCALIGMNDPMVHFLGNYDRMNLLTGKWTEVAHEEKDFGGYLLVKFDKRGLPTIGANGTVFRRDFLQKSITGNYLFDVDVLAAELQKNGRIEFIKVKQGIVHSYCESDVKKFARKQRRRIYDYMFHKNSGNRKYSWSSTNKMGLVKFGLSCILVVPLVYQTFVGYSRKKDSAWFFHILACEITFWEYFLGALKSLFNKRELDRSNWTQ